MSPLKEITEIFTSKKVLKNIAYYYITYNYPFLGLVYNVSSAYFK
jgi:hypothetical protein